ncbi:MAG: hypothetical protein ABI594_15805 [Ginsengibacter sp.]
MKNLYPLIVIFTVLFYSCEKTKEAAPVVLAEYLLGSGGNCASAIVSGRFVADTALTDLNTVTINVNVTVPGAYWITTNTVNGITFSNVGTFTAAGPQTAVLTATGTPVATDTSEFTLMAKDGSGGGCKFPVITIQGILPHYYITCLLDGMYRNFSDSTGATNSNIPGNAGMPGLDVMGMDTVINANSKIEFGVSNNGGVIAGTYTDTATAKAYFNYLDSTGEVWSVNTSAQPAFTIVVTGAGARSVQGTFYGTIKNQSGFGTDSIIVTNGLFSVPVQ